MHPSLHLPCRCSVVAVAFRSSITSRLPSLSASLANIWVLGGGGWPLRPLNIRFAPQNITAPQPTNASFPPRAASRAPPLCLLRLPLGPKRKKTKSTPPNRTRLSCTPRTCSARAPNARFSAAARRGPFCARAAPPPAPCVRRCLPPCQTRAPSEPCTTTIYPCTLYVPNLCSLSTGLPLSCPPLPFGNPPPICM